MQWAVGMWSSVWEGWAIGISFRQTDLALLIKISVSYFTFKLSFNRHSWVEDNKYLFQMGSLFLFPQVVERPGQGGPPSQHQSSWWQSSEICSPLLSVSWWNSSLRLVWWVPVPSQQAWTFQWYSGSFLFLTLLQLSVWVSASSELGK